MTTATGATRRIPGIGLLARRDFRLLWTGETTSSFGSSISSVALPLVALSVLHASVFAVSLLTAAAWLPWLLIGLPAGAWVDRLPRRRVMMAADLVSLTVFASVPLTAAFGVLTIAQLVVVALLAGASTVFFSTAYRAFLPELLDAGDLLEGNAKLQGSEQVTHIAGPGAAGLIAQALTAVGGVIADALSFAVSAVCLSRIRTVRRSPSVLAGSPGEADSPDGGSADGSAQLSPAQSGRSKPSLRREIGEGLGLVIKDPLLRVNAIFGCLSNLVLTGYQSILIVFLVRDVRLSPGVAGLTLALTSLGGVLGALVARPVAARIGTARAVLLSKLAVSPFGLLIPLADRGPGLVLFVFGSVVVIGGIVAGNVVWSGFSQTYYPADMQGRMSTSMQFVNYGAIPVGAVLAGAIASAVGVRPTVWIMLAGLVLSSCVLLLGPLRRLRDLPGPA